MRTQTPTPTLMDAGGLLCLPKGDLAIHKDGHALITKNMKASELRSVLQEARKAGDLPENCLLVILPTGQHFSID